MKRQKLDLLRRAEEVMARRKNSVVTMVAAQRWERRIAEFEAKGVRSLPTPSVRKKNAKRELSRKATALQKSADSRRGRGGSGKKEEQKGNARIPNELLGSSFVQTGYRKDWRESCSSRGDL